MSDILNRLHLRHCDEAGWRYNVIMAWKTSSVMEEKLRFVFEYVRAAQPHALSSNHGAIHGAGVGVEGQRDGCLRRAHAHPGGLRTELPRAFPAHEADG